MYYKLTDRNMQTYGRFQWVFGRWNEIVRVRRSPTLCSSSWFHCYDDPLLAIFFNPIHANIDEPRLFEIEVGGDSSKDYGLKFGFSAMRLMCEIEVPQITMTQRIAFGILCTKKVCDDLEWNKWADAWLDGSDRGVCTAEASVLDVPSTRRAFVSQAARGVSQAALYAAITQPTGTQPAVVESNCITEAVRASASAVSLVVHGIPDHEIGIDLKAIACVAMQY